MNSSILLSYLQQLDLNIEEVKPYIYIKVFHVM